MNMLMISAPILVFMTVGILAVSVLRRAKDGYSRKEYDVAIYKDQLTEVDRDLDRGVLNADQAEAARVEIERRMLGADAGAGASKGRPLSQKAHRVLTAVVVVVVPLGAAALYLDLGKPTLHDLPYAGRHDPAFQQANRLDQLRSMVVQLEEKVQRRPNDQKGVALLGQAYVALGEYEKAVKMYRRLVKLTNRGTEALAAYGEALALAGNGPIPKEAQTVFQEILVRDANDPRPYFYLGMADAQQGRLKAAIDTWMALVKRSPPDARWLPQLASLIGQASKELGVAPPPEILALSQPKLPPFASGGASGGASSGASGPTREQMQAAQNMTPEQRQAFIRSMVDKLAQQLKANPNDLQGWRRLARAYDVLGEKDKAKQARERIAALQKSGAQNQGGGQSRVAPPPGPTREQMQAAQSMTPEQRQAFIRSMVDKLAQQLKANPNDLQGWRRLARAYDVLGEKDKAKEARAKIAVLQGKP
ncbi:c-type cytochrome biogenesis protein CcmI [Varunaivibrio sulfuroxidans]|uniref:Cytochrome c-type biogenesis protein CcmH n=1 Tax=Varunaivibrio sulfuroxidans TaxID=1773489 RepID=A0A4R3JEJ2_9PROT|nr:c-type cytochrome biogenesis protein CcmI [Varunaivibrio sulfuroxidans]TCS63643.1 cytochrome c-type biogenesis protein CcmH [Varunaivibrio sulfuroxidans]WES30218.1 c-type cytochrome biogenesis protein CcmI [Varunaivibrio sulfuroxidans]